MAQKFMLFLPFLMECFPSGMVRELGGFRRENDYFC